MSYRKSDRLHNVCYDIRGPVFEAAQKIEAKGHKVLKLNIGNPAEFSLFAPDEIHVDVIHNLREADGYAPSHGLFSARKAIMQNLQLRHIDCDINRIWLGNGVSELISLITSALLNPGDEVLVPAPDYPLWTAAITLTGAVPVHYRCDESDNWQPVTHDIASKISERTRAIVVINPNNPTGVCYSADCLRALVDLAEQHELIILADEIYDKVVYPPYQHTPMASLVTQVPCLSFNGLSKSHRLAGFRSGWVTATGDLSEASDLIEGINMLCSMRLCSNVPAQLAVQTALGGIQSIDQLVAEGGRLYQQRLAATEAFRAIEGVELVTPQAAMYCFVRVCDELYDLPDRDEELVLAFLEQAHVLIVQGSAFNLQSNRYFRFVFLPSEDELIHAIHLFGEFLQRYRR